jgi:predicted nucleotide-binding protein (sugar kinase/HSP70/actin superfamily)
LLPWYRRLPAKDFKDLINWKIEHAYKHNVDKKVHEILAPTGLVPDSPHNMQEIMGNTEKHFVSHELYSEISVSVGAAATAMMDGYSGIVNISPFACLIGRVIEGLFTPWARERKYPVISIEIDGNILPPNVLSKLEIFMLNVNRFKGHADVNSMMEKEGIQSVAIDRKIIR